MAMDGDLPFLPEDIISNILKRLPVKSLIRFRCVCKYWRNLVKTPSFIAAHLHHSRNQDPYLLVARFDGDYHTIFDLVDRKMQIFQVQNAPPIHWGRDELVGSCNGLLCFRIDESFKFPFFLLWNPGTREVKHVPMPLTDFHGTLSIVFEFSPIVNDYKIVISYVTQSYYEVKRVEVYSLSTGLWKEIELGRIEGACLGNETTTVNGVIFWLGSVKGQDGDYYTRMIVSFDIATEVFAVIPMPTLEPISRLRLTFYEDKLAFLVCYESGIGNLAHSFIDFWVMEEDMDAPKEMCNWTKKYASNTYPCSLSPVTIWRSQVVCHVIVRPGRGFQRKRDEQIVLYLLNVTTNECKVFPTGRAFAGDDIFNYVESLVPLGNSHIEEL